MTAAVATAYCNVVGLGKQGVAILDKYRWLSRRRRCPQIAGLSDLSSKETSTEEEFLLVDEAMAVEGLAIAIAEWLQGQENLVHLQPEEIQDVLAREFLILRRPATERYRKALQYQLKVWTWRAVLQLRLSHRLVRDLCHHHGQHLRTNWALQHRVAPVRGMVTATLRWWRATGAPHIRRRLQFPVGLEATLDSHLAFSPDCTSGGALCPPGGCAWITTIQWGPVKERPDMDEEIRESQMHQKTAQEAAPVARVQSSPLKATEGDDEAVPAEIRAVQVAAAVVTGGDGNGDDSDDVDWVMVSSCEGYHLVDHQEVMEAFAWWVAAQIQGDPLAHPPTLKPSLTRAFKAKRRASLLQNWGSWTWRWYGWLAVVYTLLPGNMSLIRTLCWTAWIATRMMW